MLVQCKNLLVRSGHHGVKDDWVGHTPGPIDGTQHAHNRDIRARRRHRNIRRKGMLVEVQAGKKTETALHLRLKIEPLHDVQRVKIDGRGAC